MTVAEQMPAAAPAQRVPATPPVPIMRRHLDALVRLRRRHERRKGPFDRTADWLVTRIGTPQSVLVHVVLGAAWLLANTSRLPGVAAFDPYPFPLLASLTGVEALLLAVFVLITQNRQARLAEQRADMDLHVSLLSEHEATRLLTLLEAIAARVGVDAREVVGVELDELKEVLRPSIVMRELDRIEGQV